MSGRTLRSAARRALGAVGLLVGFYLVALGALAAMAAADVALVLHARTGTPVFAEGRLIGATLVLAAPLLRGLAASRIRRADAPPGVPLTPDQQPALWARVRDLAAQVGTRPPTEIRLIPAVNAAIGEDTRLLGLLPGRRRLYLGVPLLLGLTERQLDAVLAHELGHCGNHDVRFAAATVRGRTGVLALARSYRGRRALLHRPLRAFFTWYAELYLRLTQSVSRRQELAADRTAAHITGRDAAATALRRIPELDAAYGFFLDRYATVGWDAGLLPAPEELFPGFRALLAEPSRQAELAALGEQAASEPAPTDPYDSHPPIHERIAALAALPDDHRQPPALPEPPAIDLLRDPAPLCAAAAALAFPPEAADKRRVDWATLARETGRAVLTQQSAALLEAATNATGRPVRTLTDLLDAVDTGGLDPITDALPKSPEAARATGRAAREFARTSFRRSVRPLLGSALVEAGAAHWTMTWARTLHLEYAPGLQEAAEAALDALLADRPDTAPLRALPPGLPGASSPAPNTSSHSSSGR